MELYEGQGKGGGVNWAKVSEHMGGTRAPMQCFTRWSGTLKHRSLGVMKSKGYWTDAEVISIYLLLDAVQSKLAQSEMYCVYSSIYVWYQYCVSW